MSNHTHTHTHTHVQPPIQSLPPSRVDLAGPTPTPPPTHQPTRCLQGLPQRCTAPSHASDDDVLRRGVLFWDGVVLVSQLLFRGATVTPVMEDL